MSLISNSTLSGFPTTLDTFQPWSEGSGVNANFTADRVNKIEAALYQAQRHTQQVVQVVSNPEDRRRLILSSNLVTLAVSGSISLSLTLSAVQQQFLGYQAWRQGNMVFADCYNKEGIVAVFTDIKLTDPATITVFARTLDYQNGTTVPAGTYQFKVTILGRS